MFSRRVLFFAASNESPTPFAAGRAAFSTEWVAFEIALPMFPIFISRLLAGAAKSTRRASGERGQARESRRGADMFAGTVVPPCPARLFAYGQLFLLRITGSRGACEKSKAPSKLPAGSSRA